MGTDGHIAIGVRVQARIMIVMHFVLTDAMSTVNCVNDAMSFVSLMSPVSLMRCRPCHRHDVTRITDTNVTQVSMTQCHPCH